MKQNKSGETAIFAAGCFWGVQDYFDQVPGVTSTLAGYTGGHTKDPSYEQVCSHQTGHAEAVLIEFDPEVVSYESLVRHFFRIHDPTELNRQGPDIGDNYRSAIFYNSDSQRKIAEQELAKQQLTMKEKIVTELSPADIFYPAEDYHQHYSAKTGRGACHVEFSPIS